MKIAVTGSSGLIGSNLVSFLSKNGVTVSKIIRENPKDNDISWKPENGDWNSTFADGIVHLAGENIAAGKWTKAKKERIRNSRIKGTKKLCEHILKLESPPSVFVCASAIGYYGDRGMEFLNEDSSRGSGFLPDVCLGWEEAADTVSKAGIRVVNVRFGIVLSKNGGALAKMLTPFKMGMGGKIGNGNQYMSWVDIDDVAGAIHHALTTDSLKGPVNVTAPNPVTNKEFTKTLGKVLNRPAVMPMPAFIARLAFGEMANDLLLASTKVAPKRLSDSGYKFLYPELESALKHVLSVD
ncbi:nucleoside-diphosphate-sugar epimerase [Candidatus Scalindua japonica]|uniref:Nucleoside-diphosphate-sugar epimerase n=1 Tax=Candidatus Scalindua japonica TaxID=1284222 RepID=A0A286U374_9BACT|nr:TIGR01777 family oxidoreductase [Candidatus Scalindua japonica]GAX62521.1 nucleoside-diphosphate-sugar epimerase [Candidatus Scalindua japonica]